VKKIEILGLQTVPEIKPGDNLAEIVVKCSEKEIGGLKDRDIIVLTSKIVSKAAGLTKKLADVNPGRKALAISKKTGKDAKWLQLIFDEGHKIVAILPIKGIIEQHIVNASEDSRCSRELCDHEQAICLTRSKDGRLHTCDAGIDGSNHPAGVVSLLPAEPDQMANTIRQALQEYSGKQVAVILADTEIVPFGTMDFAIGSSGIEPRLKAFGKTDSFGKPKFGGMDLIASELTAASALVFGQANEGIPVAIIRGYQFEINETANITNTILFHASGKDRSKIIRATMQATASAKSLKWRLLLKVASWFV